MTEEYAMSVTVGGGLSVHGSAEAINRVQDFILLDSTHPQEREDVRRSLMRQLIAAEADIARLRAVLQRLLREDDIYAGIGGFFDEIRAALEPKP
jgi:hypothetical protein